jgi:hypothetical protein
VPDEDGVVVEELGEVLLDVLKRRCDAFELLSCDAGEPAKRTARSANEGRKRGEEEERESRRTE